MNSFSGAVAQRRSPTETAAGDADGRRVPSTGIALGASGFLNVVSSTGRPATRLRACSAPYAGGPRGRRHHGFPTPRRSGASRSEKTTLKTFVNVGIRRGTFDRTDLRAYAGKKRRRLYYRNPNDREGSHPREYRLWATLTGDGCRQLPANLTRADFMTGHLRGELQAGAPALLRVERTATGGFRPVPEATRWTTRPGGDAREPAAPVPT